MTLGTIKNPEFRRKLYPAGWLFLVVLCYLFLFDCFLVVLFEVGFFVGFFFFLGGGGGLGAVVCLFSFGLDLVGFLFGWFWVYCSCCVDGGRGGGGGGWGRWEVVEVVDVVKL